MKIEPDVAINFGGNGELILFWPSKNIPLKSRIAALGVFLMRENLCMGEFAEFEPVIHDVSEADSRTRRFKAGSIPNNVQRLLQIELIRQEEAYLAWLNEAA